MISLLEPLIPYILAFLAALGWGAYQRRVGANSEKSKSAAERIKAKTEADRIDDAVAGRDPGDVRRQLKKWTPWGKQ